MYKNEVIFENNLESGMKFKNVADAIRFVGYESYDTISNLRRLGHYCTYNRNDDYTIEIINPINPIIPFKVLDWLYDIDDEIEAAKSKYKIIDRYKIFDKRGCYKKMYKCKCLICDYEFELSQNRITCGLNCPICGGRKHIKGINTFDLLYPELKKYIVDKNILSDPTTTTADYVLCKCPECGTLKEILLHNLISYGFTCSCCSDGISYPNKYVRNFLMQLGINYIPEKSFKWSDKKIYDEYLENFSMIIENHGMQHYEKLNGLTFQELDYQISNDVFKKQIALQNGIKHYIELDCRYSDKEWIKKSILKSELPQLLHFTEKDINWDECDIFASTNRLIKDICNDWEKCHIQSDLVKKYQLHISTIRKYLTIGTQCGYCNFELSEHYDEHLKITSDIKSKPIYCVELDLYFRSKNECGEYFIDKYDKFCEKSLYNYINNNKKYKNMTFQYISKIDFNNHKNTTPEKCFGDFYGEKAIKNEAETKEKQ